MLFVGSYNLVPRSSNSYPAMNDVIEIVPSGTKTNPLTSLGNVTLYSLLNHKPLASIKAFDSVFNSLAVITDGCVLFTFYIGPSLTARITIFTASSSSMMTSCNALHARNENRQVYLPK